MNNKTKKIKRVNENTAIVTIDIGSKVHYVYLRGKGEEILPLPIYNTKNDYNNLYNMIIAFKKEYLFEDVIVGYESSGCYAEPLIHFLDKKGIKVVQINPLHTKRLKELNGNSPNKHDKKDPKVIADIIELGHSLTVVMPKGVSAELRRLIIARERAVSSRTSKSNQLTQMIYLIFPEYIEIMKSILSKSSIYILKQYSDPESIVKLGYNNLYEILFKASRGKLGENKAKSLYHAANNTIGIKEGKSSILLEIRHLIESIENENKHINELEKRIDEYLKLVSYSKNILGIKGIGNITVATMIGEVGDFNKYNNSSELLKLGGLDLYEVSSGKHKGEKKISKFGRSLLRKALYFAAINTVREGGIMHEYYIKKVNKGMIKNKALIAVARKLLKLIFAIVRDNSIYIENYQEEYINKKSA
jgi:transposase